MTRVALKGMASRPLRTFLTTLAIVLGVGMVSAAFTLTDTMRGAADSLSSAAYDGTDAVVSARTAFKVDSANDFTVQKPTIDAKVIDEVRSVPGGWASPSATSATRPASSTPTATWSVPGRIRRGLRRPRPRAPLR